MIKVVLISIKGIQGIDGETDTIAFMTEGRFGIKNGEYYISYDESGMLDSGEEVKTHIYIKSSDSLVLQRTGAIKSRMLVEKEKRNTCFYQTPHGELVIGIFGELIEHDFTEKGGNLTLKYSIDSNLTLISKNEVKISIREV